jgi:hypothetical protein
MQFTTDSRALHHSSLQDAAAVQTTLGHAAHKLLQVQAQASTSFMPRQLAEVTEPAAQAMAARMQRTPVSIPSLPIPPLATAFVGPSETQKQQLRAISQDRPPVVLLHGFDSSSLEFRRLYPLLEPHTETYAVDLVRAAAVRIIYQHVSHQKHFTWSTIILLYVLTAP